MFGGLGAYTYNPSTRGQESGYKWEDNQGCTGLKTVREKPSENPTQPW